MKKKERLKKIKVSKQIKITIMIGLIIIVGVLGALCLKTYKTPEITKEEKVLYDYTHANAVEYAVNLKPNQVYKEDKLDEGRIYLTEFVQDINTYFTSQFISSEAGNIQGKYEIIAQVAGYMTEEKVKVDVWSKDFVLVPEESFTGEGKEYKVEKTIKVNYQGYDEFAKAVAEVTKVNLPMELRIIMRGNISATTPQKVVEQPILTSVIVPLGNSYFAITTEGEVENKDAVKEEIEVILPLNTNKIIVYGILIGIALLLFVIVYVLFIPLTVEDMNLRYIKQILNTHGSRMVGVNQAIETGDRISYEIKNIEDLIKIADELEKPVLYSSSENMLEINTFYVLDKETMYRCTLEMKLQLPIESPIEITGPKEESNQINL